MELGPQPPPQPRLVCFDLGRVLIGLADDLRDACRRAGVTLDGWPLDAERQARLAGVSDDANLGRLDHPAYITHYAEISGLTTAQVEAVCDAWLTGPLPGALALVRQVIERGLLTACLTNTIDRHWRLINQRGGRHDLELYRMHWRFASHLLHLAKPDAAIYAHVEKATGLRGEEILLFDDLPANCATAAQRRWQVCHIDSHHDSADQMRRALRQRGVAV